MVDAALVARFAPQTLLINTARGRLLSLDALYEGLRSGAIGGAGLDVLPNEPPDPDHPLIMAWSARESWLSGRLILTPHSAFLNRESMIEMREKAADEALRVLSGKPARNCVNQEYLVTT